MPLLDGVAHQRAQHSCWIVATNRRQRQRRRFAAAQSDVGSRWHRATGSLIYEQRAVTHDIDIRVVRHALEWIDADTMPLADWQPSILEHLRCADATRPCQRVNSDPLTSLELHTARLYLRDQRVHA